MIVSAGNVALSSAAYSKNALVSNNLNDCCCSLFVVHYLLFRLLDRLKSVPLVPLLLEVLSFFFIKKILFLFHYFLF